MVERGCYKYRLWYLCCIFQKRVTSKRVKTKVKGGHESEGTGMF